MTAKIDAAEVAVRLRHVYWIGGGSGSGKSTMARRFARNYGWQLYATDDAMGDHARRSTPEGAPFLHRFMAMDMDERWVNRTPEAMLDTFHWFRGEGFGLIVEDLLRMPPEPCVIVEGFRLLPRLVRPLLAVPERAVWLLPTPEFREAALRSRALPSDGFVGKTGDPARAAHNLAERDRLFTEHLRKETRRLHLQALEVDSATAEDHLAERITAAFRL